MTAMPEAPYAADSFVCTAMVLSRYSAKFGLRYICCKFHARTETEMEALYTEAHMREESGWCCGECGAWHLFESDAQGCCRG